jgi:hypothetical protein
MAIYGVREKNVCSGGSNLALTRDRFVWVTVTPMNTLCGRPRRSRWTKVHSPRPSPCSGPQALRRIAGQVDATSAVPRQSRRPAFGCALRLEVGAHGPVGLIVTPMVFRSQPFWLYLPAPTHIPTITYSHPTPLATSICTHPVVVCCQEDDTPSEWLAADSGPFLFV